MDFLIVTTIYVLGIFGLTVQVLKDRKEYYEYHGKQN